MSSIRLAQGAQPLGLLHLPFGLLLLPPVADDGGALARVLAGDASGPLPPAWSFWAAAAEGDAETALAWLDGQEGAVAEYDRLALAPTPERFAALRSAASGDLLQLVLAVGYVHGLIDDIPEPAGAEAPEVAGVLALPAAAGMVEAGDIAGAVALLDGLVPRVAAASPMLAAQLEAQAADLEHGSNPGRAIARLRSALARVGDAPLAAGLWLQLGLYLHDGSDGQRSSLTGAIEAYQAAVHAGLTREANPEAFALVQNNLGLAYLSMPKGGAGEALRSAVAVQSFREALSVYGPESHPEQWTSVQQNLANALQYLPSSHPQENLVQAVEIYDQLLARRPKSHDPVGHARLLANQGNALAHLGMFSPALERLDEAHKLFHWHGEPELAAAVLEQVSRIHEQRAVLAEAAEPAETTP